MIRITESGESRNQVLLRVEGSLGEGEARVLTEACRCCRARGAERIELDLLGVVSIDPFLCDKMAQVFHAAESVRVRCRGAVRSHLVSWGLESYLARELGEMTGGQPCGGS